MSLWFLQMEGRHYKKKKCSKRLLSASVLSEGLHQQSTAPASVIEQQQIWLVKSKLHSPLSLHRGSDNDKKRDLNCLQNSTGSQLQHCLIFGYDLMLIKASSGECWVWFWDILESDNFKL